MKNNIFFDFFSCHSFATHRSFGHNVQRALDLCISKENPTISHSFKSKPKVPVSIRSTYCYRCLSGSCVPFIFHIFYNISFRSIAYRVAAIYTLQLQTLHGRVVAPVRARSSIARVPRKRRKCCDFANSSVKMQTSLGGSSGHGYCRCRRPTVSIYLEEEKLVARRTNNVKRVFSLTRDVK